MTREDTARHEKTRQGTRRHGKAREDTTRHDKTRQSTRARGTECFLLTHKYFFIVHKPNTDFGYNPKIPSTQRLLVFSIPIEGALHEYG